jgi:hypothetical protein
MAQQVTAPKKNAGRHQSICKSSRSLRESFFILQMSNKHLALLVASRQTAVSTALSVAANRYR